MSKIQKVTVRFVVVIAIVVCGILSQVAYASDQHSKNILLQQLKQADKELNSAYKNALIGPDNKNKQIHRREQSVWLKERDRQCGSSAKGMNREEWLLNVAQNEEQGRCVLEKNRIRISQLNDAGKIHRYGKVVSHTWQKEIHNSVGVMEFKYEGEDLGISVRTLRDNKITQNISVYFTEEGWLEFYDLDGNGYQDIVIHSPDWNFGSPISHGKIWIFKPKTMKFEEAEDISGRGFVEKATEQGCLILTYRNSYSKSPFYIGELWCFDKLSEKWSHKRDILDHFPK